MEVQGDAYISGGSRHGHGRVYRSEWWHGLLSLELCVVYSNPVRGMDVCFLCVCVYMFYPSQNVGRTDPSSKASRHMSRIKINKYKKWKSLSRIDQYRRIKKFVANALDVPKFEVLLRYTSIEFVLTVSNLGLTLCATSFNTTFYSRSVFMCFVSNS